jgi:hypothetical protein
MKDYVVRFYYHADLRADWSGKAFDERMALSLAMAEIGHAQWCNGRGFRVEIEEICEF